MAEKTPADIAIAAFGGVEALASATKIPVKRIYRWRQSLAKGGSDGRVPANQQGVILRAARKRRLDLCAEDLIDMRVAEDVQ